MRDLSLTTTSVSERLIRINQNIRITIELHHEIMELFALHKLNLQTHMRSHPVGLDV